MKALHSHFFCGKQFMVSLILATTLFAIPVSAQIQHYYVATSGSDSNDGSQTRPWATLNHADAALTLGPDGTVVHVAPGTYQGANVYHGGTSDSRRVTYVSDTSWGAHLNSQFQVSGATDRSGTTPEGAAWGDFITIQGFDIGNYNGSQGILIRGSHTDVIHNYVHDITSSSCPQSGGITHVPNAGGARIGGHWDRNMVVNIGPPLSVFCNTQHGMYSGMPYTIITNNVVIGARDKGIQVGDTGACHVVVANNTLLRNGEEGVIAAIASGDQSVVDPANPACNGVNDYNTFINNLCADNGQSNQTSPACVRIYQNGPIGAHNVIYNNAVLSSGMVSNICSGCSVAVSGNLTSSQTLSQVLVNFQADGSGDYHPKSGTVAVSSGTANCAPSVNNCAPPADFATTIRPSPPSIGAFEADGVSGSLPAPPTGLTAVVQ